MSEVIKSRAEFDGALKHSGLVVVDFFATWCGPCKMIAPLLEKFAKEYPQAKFIQVDVDQFAEIAQEYEVTAMPTIFFIKNGSVVHKVLGAQPQAIKQALTDFS